MVGLATLTKTEILVCIPVTKTIKKINHLIPVSNKQAWLVNYQELKEVEIQILMSGKQSLKKTVIRGKKSNYLKIIIRLGNQRSN